MRITSIIYYVIAIVLLVFLMSLALPFLKNLMPGLKLVYIIFPVIFILLTHYNPVEIIRAFRLAGRNSKGSQKEYKTALLFFKTMQNIFITLMLIGIPVLIIWLLAGPQTTPVQIAHIVAIIIGAFFYPLFFILFICLPFKSAIQKKMNELEGSKPGM